MGFFQNSVINKHIKALDKAVVNTAYTKFKEYFHNPEIQHNIREAKEEQFQEGFLRELFVKVLGYTLNPQPNFNLTTELKNEKGANKADGAILKDGKALVVIELKGTDTKDLDKINTQAFNYKNNQTGCIYVITSNFEKLRFFIHNSVDHLEFNLFTLTEQEFELLWLCLSVDCLLGGIPLKVKEESLLAEENVTKQLYKDYAAFRIDLWQNMVKNRPDIDQLLLFKKTQKLLDRFLFIFFAEDSGLLPPNSISRIVERWNVLQEEDAYKPLYSIFNQYFGYINTGRKGKTPQDDIFAYNGGLFFSDEVLDNIVIDDDVLQPHVMKLTTYDFLSEIDVNILGHIFENSLSEIENVIAKLEGKEVDKNKTKRKKEGVFYTPKYITKYIVDNTVGKLCEEKKAELSIVDEEYTKGRRNRKKETIKKLDKGLQTYKKWLLNINICDPACGSGAFLNQALEYLIAEHTYIDELQAHLLGRSIVFHDVSNHILERNIYGVDINEESVDIAKLSLWLRTAQKGRELTTLNNNLKCGNSLIDDTEVAGDKAFNWQKEFPEVFAKGGFDVVIGNPPYVFAREKITEKEKDFYSRNFLSSEYQVNTYILFIEKSCNLIRKNGLFGLIVPNAWLMVKSASNLRKYLLENSSINKILNISGHSFEVANVETVIILAQRNNTTNNQIKIFQNEGSIFKHLHNSKQSTFHKKENFEFTVFLDSESIDLTEKIRKNSVILNEISLIKAGLKAYEKSKGTPPQTADDVKSRPFDYFFKYDETTYKYLEGKDVLRYGLNWTGAFLKYGEHLAAPRTFDIFDGQKIIIREITGNYPISINATFSDETYLFNMSNIAVLPGNKDINLKYVLVVLNSKLMAYYFLKNTAKSIRKMFPKIILNDLRKFPFKEIGKNEQQPFIEKADQMLEPNKQLQKKKSKFLGLLKDNLEVEKISKKLNAFYNFDFNTFLDELKKLKIKLSFSNQVEWKDFFEQYKTEINQLQSEISKTDKEIDKMVYKLYGLTENEIAIIEHTT